MIRVHILNVEQQVLLVKCHHHKKKQLVNKKEKLRKMTHKEVRDKNQL
jgi:hypothetical protein